MVNFLLSQDSENILLEIIKIDIDDDVFLTISQALGIIVKLISGPFLRNVTLFSQIFDFKNEWQSLLNFLQLNSHKVSNLFNGNKILDKSLLTKDAIFQKLFQLTNNSIVDSLTEECLELICCT